MCLPAQVFNEPEWCISGDTCKTTQCVSRRQMQRFVAMVADAVHRTTHLKVCAPLSRTTFTSKYSSGPSHNPPQGARGGLPQVLCVHIRSASPHAKGISASLVSLCNSLLGTRSPRPSRRFKSSKFRRSRSESLFSRRGLLLCIPHV